MAEWGRHVVAVGGRVGKRKLYCPCADDLWDHDAVLADRCPAGRSASLPAIKRYSSANGVPRGMAVEVAQLGHVDAACRQAAVRAAQGVAGIERAAVGLGKTISRVPARFWRVCSGLAESSPCSNNIKK